jgi:hypothetical protein
VPEYYDSDDWRIAPRPQNGRALWDYLSIYLYIFYFVG